MSTSNIQMDVYGVGQVNVEGPGETTSSEVQEVWTAQVTIINEVINNINQGIYNPDDLDRLVEALNVLEDLAENGITASNGTTYYITNDMADALDDMFEAFAAVGITPNMNTSAMTDEEKVNALKSASTASGAEGEAIQKAVTTSTNVVYQDLSLQYYAMAMFADMIYSSGSEFDSLATYLEFVDQALESLNDLMEIAKYGEVQEPWVADPSLENSGDIPYNAAAEINTYLKNNLSTDDWEEYGQYFWPTYQSEYNQAVELAEQNGTTVQEEMAAFNGASSILKEIMLLDEDYAEGIGGILSKYLTAEPIVVIETMSYETTVEIVNQIWSTLEGLETLIDQLEAQPGVDQDLIDALQDIVNFINEAWEKALYYTPYNVNDYPTPQSYIDALESGEITDDRALTEFVENIVISLQPPNGELYKLTDSAITTYQNFNEELQKEFQKQMTMMESLFRMAGSVLKSINDAYMQIASNI